MVSVQIILIFCRVNTPIICAEAIFCNVTFSATLFSEEVFRKIPFTNERECPNLHRIISNLLIAHLFSLITGDLDYEKQSLHQLRIVAKDRANFGRVNSATTGILIRVQDIEDKAPEFVSVPSVTRIAEDVPTFTEVCSCS